MLRKSHNRLKVLRAEFGYVQYDVAEKLGIGINRYWQIENARTTATPDEVRKLARLFRCAPTDIFPQVAA